VFGAIEACSGHRPNSQCLSIGLFFFLVGAVVGIISPASAQSPESAFRSWHIPNANLGNKNPEFNGIQVNLAWHWYE
jgi:hypothetical protein